MEIYELLDDAKKKIAEMKKKYKFRSANKQRERAAELLKDELACQGRLKVCQREFERIIKEQSSAVREGREKGMDIFIQQNNLHEAAVGYLLVRDAMFALDSISSNDSIVHAYDLLETATLQMQGKKPLKNLIPGVVATKGDRDKYGFLTADATLADKNAYISTFFSKLIETGDIEKCIEESTPVPVHDGNILSGNIGSNASNEAQKCMEEIRKINGSSLLGEQPVELSKIRGNIVNADAPKKKGD